ncbi:hypothetical protein SOQ14_08750 [Erythrobacter sp. T5W1-R]|uniref:hypothetical protein n=1 Tax=Erythrobacter sp. T5W1-R TaxID=3101752 RepID=UPI002AFF62AD|nr:hypothetical protein [Erythrobacter sp. T5W1-R]MEA1619007.1 hypothetical protein [Erythrobacter sp. T5W1-R]
MNALVPAGTMIMQTGGYDAEIILCPETHPLARALGTAKAPDKAALHAAMGHGDLHERDPDAMDHHGMGHHGMDHAAMGHAAEPQDDPAQLPDPMGQSAPAQSCAFAGLGLAALPIADNVVIPEFSATLPEPLAHFARLQLVAPAYLRPPLRAPPHGDLTA